MLDAKEHPDSEDGLMGVKPTRSGALTSDIIKGESMLEVEPPLSNFLATLRASDSYRKKGNDIINTIIINQKGRKYVTFCHAYVTYLILHAHNRISQPEAILRVYQLLAFICQC